MDHDPQVAEALAATHATDRTAYESFGARGQAVARRAGDWGFRARRWLGSLSLDALRWSERVLGAVLDWLLRVLDKVLFGPYRLLSRAVAALSAVVVGGLKAGVGGFVWLASGLLGLLDLSLGRLARAIGLRGGSAALRERIMQLRLRIARARRLLIVFRRAARRAIDRGWRRLRASLSALLSRLIAGLDWGGRNLLFRPCAWLFNPRWPGGRPLLVHEGATRLAGFVLAAIALYVGALILAYIKTKALILHGTINTALWKADASYAANMLTIGAAHASISLTVALSKFVLLPVLAAARRGMKNNRYTQAVAYAYTRRRLAAERIDARNESHEPTAVGATTVAGSAVAPAAAPPRRPLAFLERLTHHIIAGTVPEVYEVKLARQRGVAVPRGTPAPGAAE